MSKHQTNLAKAFERIYSACNQAAMSYRVGTIVGTIYSPPIADKLSINTGDWFKADIIGLGIYEMVKHGINSNNYYFAIVRLKKLFGYSKMYRNHETTCHPIKTSEWNKLKRFKRKEVKG